MAINSNKDQQLHILQTMHLHHEYTNSLGP